MMGEISLDDWNEKNDQDEPRLTEWSRKLIRKARKEINEGEYQTKFTNQLNSGDNLIVHLHKC